MNPLPELINGLDLLEPFLIKHGFKLDNYENGGGSGGQFTIATYKNGHKRFVIGYRYSIGELYYQCDDLKVAHDFYLRQLGYADIMKFPDFQSEDKLQTFRNVFHDFELLKDDFFEGDCIELKRIEKLQKDYIGELQEQSKIKGQNEADLRRIEIARQRFKSRDYNGSLTIYKTVIDKSLLSDFDQKAVDYCQSKERC